MLSPEVIGPSLSLPPSSRSIRRMQNSSIRYVGGIPIVNWSNDHHLSHSSSFGASSSACEHTASTSASREFHKSPVTISSASQSPWQPIPPAGMAELMRERERESTMFRGESGEKGIGLRGQSAQQSSQMRGQDTQQARDVLKRLERIKLEHLRSVEDRKTMAELIEKKIHLHQSERMAIEDARVSRLRQQLASTSVDGKRGKEEEGEKLHTETLVPLSDNQASKVCCTT